MGRRWAFLIYDATTVDIGVVSGLRENPLVDYCCYCSYASYNHGITIGVVDLLFDTTYPSDMFSQRTWLKEPCDFETLKSFIKRFPEHVEYSVGDIEESLDPV